MADYLSTIAEALSRDGALLKWVSLPHEKLTDSQLVDLVNCLLAHPNAAMFVNLHINKLTDETGIKLARYLTDSSIVESMDLSYNHFGEATYLVLAAALRVNSSLQWLYLYNNEEVDRTRVDATFVEALRLNPVRPTGSFWCLYTATSEFGRLKCAADALGPPSMLSQLRHRDRT